MYFPLDTPQILQKSAPSFLSFLSLLSKPILSPLADMDDDWDLYAVVRSCSAASTAGTVTGKSTLTTTPSQTRWETPPIFSAIRVEENEHFVKFPDLQEAKRRENIEDLHEMFKPFGHKIDTQNKTFGPKTHTISPQNIPISPLSVLGDYLPQQPPQKRQRVEPKTTFSISHLPPTTTTTTTTRHTSQNSRSKRR